MAALASSGIVFASDSRTNAGTDEVSAYSKLTLFEAPGRCAVVLLAAGNLASSQSVVSLLHERREPLFGKSTLYETARFIGDVVREVMERDAATLAKANIQPGCSFLLGGQIHGEPPRLFEIYPQGNFIEATRETNYLQLGETRYGKPVLEALLRFDSGLDVAAKCLLLAMQATMRFDVSVGPPIDLLAYDKDALRITRRRRYEERDPYLHELGELWPRAMAQVLSQIPEVRWH